jgi:hypothetical protein
VQSLAARQYLPRVDTLLNREKLADYSGPPLKLIVNGWFTHNADNWIPSPQIIPHFVSFHINSSAADRILSNQGVAYLRKHSPIGCRDRYTVSLLRAKGVDAYFTGCLTLTLNSYAVSQAVRQEFILVDPFFNLPSTRNAFSSPRAFASALRSGEILHLHQRNKLLRRGFTADCLAAMERVTQEITPCGQAEPELFDIAEARLRRYAQAKLVVTSRIHCALPCLAMGTPVIFLNAFDNIVDTCRFDGLLDLFNRIDFASDGRPSTNFGDNCPLDGSRIPANLTRHVEMAENLRASCNRFIEAV